MELIFNLQNIENAAREFIGYMQVYTVIAFHGNLGAGKTTFIKSICKALGVKENISSPTFSIINQYKTENNNTVFHIDLYRLKDMEEAINAGVEECMYSADLCFIEWPEKVSSILPADTVNVFIEAVDANTRKIIVNLPQLNSF